MQSKQLSPLWFSHGLLVIAAVLTWNLLSLGYLIYDRSYILRRGDWWVLVTLGAFLLSLTIIGLLRVRAEAKKHESIVADTPRIRWPFPLGTGFATFLVGWLPCIYVMDEMMRLGYFCLNGAIAHSIAVWLPIGVVTSVLAASISWKVTKRLAVP